MRKKNLFENMWCDHILGQCLLMECCQNSDSTDVPCCCHASVHKNRFQNCRDLR